MFSFCQVAVLNGADLPLSCSQAPPSVCSCATACGLVPLRLMLPLIVWSRLWPPGCPTAELLSHNGAVVPQLFSFGMSKLSVEKSTKKQCPLGAYTLMSSGEMLWDSVSALFHPTPPLHPCLESALTKWTLCVPIPPF